MTKRTYKQAEKLFLEEMDNSGNDSKYSLKIVREEFGKRLSSEVNKVYKEYMKIR